jgi:type I restriction enzyme R subunit
MAVARAMASNNTLASALLKEDRQSLGIMTNLIYDLLKSGGDINLSDLNVT